MTDELPPTRESFWAGITSKSPLKQIAERQDLHTLLLLAMLGALLIIAAYVMWWLNATSFPSRLLDKLDVIIALLEAG